MQSYTVIIGVLEMREKHFSYRDIRSRYGIGQGTVKQGNIMRKFLIQISRKSRNVLNVILIIKSRCHLLHTRNPTEIIHHIHS